MFEGGSLLMANDNAFQISSANLRFGFGCTREVGLDLRELGSRRVMLVVDPALVDLYSGRTVLESLRASNIDFALFTDVQTEPTDESFRRATEFAVEGGFDALVAVGGGSTHRHGQGGESVLHPSGRLFRLRQRPDRQRSARPRSAQTADRHSDNRRHRQ